MGSAVSSVKEDIALGSVSSSIATHQPQLTFTPPDLTSGLTNSKHTANEIAKHVAFTNVKSGERQVSRPHLRFFRKIRPRKIAKRTTADESDIHACHKNESQANNNKSINLVNEQVKIVLRKGIAWKINSAIHIPHHDQFASEKRENIVNLDLANSSSSSSQSKLHSVTATVCELGSFNPARNRQNPAAQHRQGFLKQARHIQMKTRDVSMNSKVGDNFKLNANKNTTLIRQLQASRINVAVKQEERIWREDSRCETEVHTTNTLQTNSNINISNNNNNNNYNNNNNRSNSFEGDSWHLSAMDSPRFTQVSTSSGRTGDRTNLTTTRPNAYSNRNHASNIQHQYSTSTNNSQAEINGIQHTHALNKAASAHPCISAVFGPTTKVVLVSPTPATGSNHISTTLSDTISTSNIHIGAEQQLPQFSSGYRCQQQISMGWRKGDLIGAGSYGHVYQALDQDSGALIAVKEVRTANKKEIRLVQREIDIMRALKHSNVVRFLGSRVDIDSGTVYIITEWVPGGSISSLVQRFGALGENTVRSYGKQLMNVLAYLHGLNIVHSDVKGANVLVDANGCVKLADFGAAWHNKSKTINGQHNDDHHQQDGLECCISDMDEPQEQFSLRGTPAFLAPEIILETSRGDKASDIWSAACTILQMVSGQRPWKTLAFRSVTAMLYHISNTRTPPPLPDSISSELVSLLLICFQREPSERPTALETLQHPFWKSKRL